MILCIQLIAHINLLACVPACACISGNSLPRVSICKRYNHHLVLNYLDDLPWSNCSHSVGCFCPLLHWRVKEHFRYTDKIMFINWIICVKLRNLKQVVCYKTVNIPMIGGEIFNFFFLMSRIGFYISVLEQKYVQEISRVYNINKWSHVEVVSKKSFCGN